MLEEDFKAIEEYVVKYSNQKGNTIPKASFIKRGTLTTQEDLKRLREIFIVYEFMHYKMLCETKQQFKKRFGCNYVDPFKVECICEDCGKIIIQECDDTDIFERIILDEEWIDIFYRKKKVSSLTLSSIKKRLRDNRLSHFLCEECHEKRLEKRAIERRQKEEREREALERYRITLANIKRKKYENDKEAYKYIIKYENKNFDFYDAISLFFNTGTNVVNMLNRIAMNYDLLDMLRVAFSEPQREEKENYIREFYSHNQYRVFLMTPYW